MKKMIFSVMFLTLVPYASIASADSSASLYSALLSAGAQPRGPSTISQTIRVTNLKCSGGFSEELKRPVSNCDFTDGDKDIQVSGVSAANLLAALIDAKMANQGTEISAASLDVLTCTKSNMDGAKSYSCTAN